MPARPTRLYHKIENSELAERKVTACADRNVRATDSELSLDDFAAAQAGGADSNALVGALHLGVNRTQIHIPAAAAHVVGVADGISKLRPLAADIANLCHDYSR